MSAYQKFDSGFINPPHKKLNWFNRNFFYISTLAIIGVLCLCFFVFWNYLDKLVESNIQWNIILMPLRHSDISDLIGNIIFFAIISLVLERHFGSIKYIGLVILSFIPASLATFAFTGSWAWSGFGSVAYFLAAVMILVMIFNMKVYFFGKCRWIFPFIILGLTALLMCWNGTANWPQVSFKFGVFNNLVENWQPFALGAIIATFTKLATFEVKKKPRKREIKKSHTILKHERLVTPLLNTEVLVSKKNKK